jgi:hypothetical protein
MPPVKSRRIVLMVHRTASGLRRKPRGMCLQGDSHEREENWKRLTFL